MTYSNKFVMCIIIDGTIQKESDSGSVFIPFGTEYTIRFRNKNNKRAVVRFSIDGEDVGGNGYVIPSNDYIDIKRHHDKDKAFKIVSIDSQEAMDFGKNGNNDIKGHIVAKFYLEKDSIKYNSTLNNHYWKSSATDNDYWMRRDTSSVPPAGRYAPITLGSGAPVNISFNSTPIGVTVEGGFTGQSFTSTNINLESNFIQLELVLRGYVVVMGTKNCTEADKATIEASRSEESNHGSYVRTIEIQNQRIQEEINEYKKIKSLLDEQKKLKEELEK